MMKMRNISYEISCNVPFLFSFQIAQHIEGDCPVAVFNCALRDYGCTFKVSKHTNWFTDWSNTQAIRRQHPANCLSVFDHVVGLALKGLSEVFLTPLTLSAHFQPQFCSGIYVLFVDSRR